MRPLIIAAILLHFGFARVAFSQTPEISFKELIIQSSQKAIELSRQAFPDLSSELEAIFLEQLESDLSEIQDELQQASAKHREVITKRIHSFVTQQIRTEAQGRIIVNQVGDGSVQGDVEPQDSGLCKLSMKIVSRQLMLAIRGALRISPPILEGAARELIREQNIALIKQAILTMSRLFPDYDSDTREKTLDSVLSRITGRMDDPFSPRCKRPLSQQEMDELIATWDSLEIDSVRLAPTRERPPMFLDSMQRAELMQTATMMLREWSRLYHDQDWMAADATMEELLNEKHAAWQNH